MEKSFLFRCFLIFFLLPLGSCSSISNADIIMDPVLFGSYDHQGKFYILEDFLRESLLENSASPSSLQKRLKAIYEKEDYHLIRSSALLNFAKIKQGFDPIFLQALKDSSSLVRYTAILLVQKYPHDSTFQTLAGMAKLDSSIHCRRESAKALSHFENAEVVLFRIDDSISPKSMLSELSRGKIPEILFDEFQKNRILLGQKTSIRVMRPDEQWEILDQNEKWNLRMDGKFLVISTSLLEELIRILPQEQDLGVQLAIHFTLKKLTKQSLEFYPEVWKEWQESQKKT